MARRWTKRAKGELLQGIGVYGADWFKKHCGEDGERRTYAAVHSAAQREFGSGGLTRGSYTVARICKLTGYDKTAIRRAMRALAQKWKRLSPKGAYLIYEDQYQDIIQWLATDYWSKVHRLYNCLWCAQTKLPHGGKGLCIRCYQRYVALLRARQLPTDNVDLLILVRKQLGENVDKIEKLLFRGRALPEAIVQKLSGLLCFC